MSNYFSKICISSLAMLYLTFSSASLLRADELSAEEILAKSRVAMEQPLRYTSVSADEKEKVVYSKTLPDGSNARLTNCQTTKNISISYDKKIYHIYLEYHIAIDMSNILKNFEDQANSFVLELDNTTPRKLYEIAGITRHNDRNCYEIFETPSPEFIDAIWDKIPDNTRSRFPGKTRFLIDKENYLLIMKETSTEEGVILSKIEYKDFHPQPDLTDDFFQLPPGLEILSPNSMKEYIDVAANRLVPKRSVDVEAEFKAVFARLKKESDARIERINKAAAEEKARIDAEFEKRRQEVRSRAKEHVKPQEPYPLPPPPNRWKTVLLANVAIIAAFIALYFYFRRRNRVNG